METTIRRHKAAVGRITYDEATGESHKWCAFCKREVVSSSRLRRVGPGRLTSRNYAETKHK